MYKFYECRIKIIEVVLIYATGDVYCQTCARCRKRQKCTKRLSIQKFPQILIIRIFFYISSMVIGVGVPLAAKR